MNTIEKGNQVAEYRPDVIDLPHEDTSSAALILSGDAMDRAVRFADLMASGKATVPAHLQKNPGDCLAITIQAMQWRMNPFAVAQKTHLVSGTLGYEAQLVNAVIVTSGAINGRPDYEWHGNWKDIDGKANKSDDLAVTVSATIKGEAAPRSLRVSMAQAGVRNSPLWVHDPRQQLAYLGLKRWSRLHTPDVMLGVYTPDELEERAPVRNMGQAEVIRDLPSDELVKASQDAAALGMVAYQRFWAETSKPDRKLLVEYHEDNKKMADKVDRLAQEKAERAADRTAAKAPKQESQVATPAANAAPEVTAKMVFDCLTAAFDAKDMDELNTAADMIRSVADEKQRVALTNEFNSMRDTLEGGAQ